MRTQHEVEPSSPTPLPLDKTPRKIAGMFDAIAGRYDLLNRLLSAGFDRRWRARAVRALDLTRGASVLDLCTGTADLALTLATADDRCHVVGVDFSAEMLRHAHRKVSASEVVGRVELLRGDATQVPVLASTVDAVTIAFGIRNVQEPAEALREVYRVLRPGGRLAVLEFGYPRRAPIRAFYLWYFRTVLPRVGRVVSRHRTAYSYLPASVGTFWEPESFCRALAEAGFVHADARPLTCGVVYLYLATKPGGA